MLGSVLRVRYELTLLINEGPIFTTYAAADRLQGREVCVRLIRPPFSTEKDFVQKVRDVVQQYAPVQHPGVEVMIELDEDEGTPFLISELTKGLPLADRIRKLAPFSVPVAVSTAISLCEALDALHGFGLAHGDVSAQNVAALPDGQIRLQLPGLWQAYGASTIAAGIVLPSMSPYLAPEISDGGMPNPAGDVYAAGVLLYELLTGRLPFNADTPISMALKHATNPIPTVRMYNPSVPGVLDEIVKKSLSKDPNIRYGTAGALLSDLRVLQDALRFGRTVTWPITPESTPPQVNAMPKTAAPRSEPTTPPAKNKKRAEREPPDVPLVMWFLIAIFGSAASVILGIWIYYNMSKPTLVKVPTLQGLSMTEARETLKPSKLDVQIDGRKFSEKVPADHVLSTDPEAGQEVREGSHVHVILSSGSQFAQVPDLKGNSVDQARSILETAHLELDDNYELKGSKKIQAGLIISQDPKAGDRIDHARKIKVVVSAGDDGTAGSDSGDTSTPTGDGPTNWYTLRVKLSNLTNPVTLRIDILDDNGTRTVFEQEMEPEKEAELSTRGTGKQIKFRIYYDDELVKEVVQKATDGSPTRPNGDNNDQ